MRSVREFARGLAATDHPLLVHLVPIRRCNIDCGYCNEYDKVSKPVPLDDMLARIDKLAFTGSTSTGKKVMATCAENLTPVVIECGGKDALLVDEDADGQG